MPSALPAIPSVAPLERSLSRASASSLLDWFEAVLAPVLASPSARALAEALATVQPILDALDWSELVALLSQHRARLHVRYRATLPNPAQRRQAIRRLVETSALVRRHLAAARCRRTAPLRLAAVRRGEHPCEAQAQLWTDASLRCGQVGLGVVLETSTRRYALALPMCATLHSGVAELAALQAGLALARSLQLDSLRAFTDSDHVIHSLRHPADMPRAFARLPELLEEFTSVGVYRIARLFNHEADELAASAMA